MQNKNSHSLDYSDLQRLVIFIVLLYLVFLFIDLVAQILTFFAIIVLVALLLNPVVVWLENRGLKRSLAAAATLVLALSVIALIITFAIPTIIKQVNLLIQEIPDITNSIVSQLKKFANDLPFINKLSAKFDISKLFSAPIFLRQAAQIGQNLLGIIFLNVLALFVIAYLLADPRPLLAGLFQFFGEDKITRIRESLILLSQNLSRWFYTTLIIGLINGLLVGVGLLLLGVDFAFIFAVLLVVAEFVPYVGPLAIGIIAVVFGLSESLTTALLIALIFIAVQALESVAWGPFILAKSLEFHPVSIVFAILVGEVVLGLAGAILAVPALIAIRIFYQEFWKKPISQKLLESEAKKVMMLKS